MAELLPLSGSGEPLMPRILTYAVLAGALAVIAAPALAQDQDHDRQRGRGRSDERRGERTQPAPPANRAVPRTTPPPQASSRRDNDRRDNDRRGRPARRRGRRTGPGRTRPVAIPPAPAGVSRPSYVGRCRHRDLSTRPRSRSSNVLRASLRSFSIPSRRERKSCVYAAV